MTTPRPIDRPTPRPAARFRSLALAAALAGMIGVVGCDGGTDVADPAATTADPAGAAADPAAISAPITAAEFVAQAASFNAYARQLAELAIERYSAPAGGVTPGATGEAAKEEQEVLDFSRADLESHAAMRDALAAAAAEANVAAPADAAPADAAGEMTAQRRDTLAFLRGRDGAEFIDSYHAAALEANEQAVALFGRAEASLSTGPLGRFAASTLPTLRQHVERLESHDHGHAGHAH